MNQIDMPHDLIWGIVSRIWNDSPAQPRYAKRQQQIASLADLLLAWRSAAKGGYASLDNTSVPAADSMPPMPLTSDSLAFGT